MHLKSSDSLQTLEVLHGLPPPLGDDARIDMVEASAWINTDFTKAKAAARRAIAKASEQGSHLIVARTYGILCQQGPATGATSEALNDCENALQSSVAAKDRNGAAMMLSNLAALYYQMGDLARSETMFRKAIEEFHKVGNLDGIATSLSNLAASRLTQGDLVQAKKLLEESIPQYQAVEDKEGIALNLNNLAEVSRQSGNLAVAETTFQQAKATAQEIEDKNAIGYVLNGLGDVYLDRGDLVAARKSYEQALALRTQTGEKQYAAETQVALAQLSIEEGHGGDAEVVLRKCRDQFHHDQEADDELTATVALVRSLLAQEKEGAAEKEIKAAEPLAAKTQNRLTRLEFELAQARVSFTLEQPKSSNSKLQRLLQETRRYGFMSMELNARLALAEVERKAGNTASAEEEFDSLEKSARAKGFGLIARKAAEARGYSPRKFGS